MWKVVLIFRNIFPCKPPPPPPPLKCIFLDCDLLATIHFFQKFFSLCLLWVVDIVDAQNYFVFLFTNLMQIKEKAHMPVTIRFPDYAFNENIHMYSFQEWNVSLIQLFYDRQKIKNKSLLGLEKSCWLCNPSCWPSDLPACQLAQAQQTFT